MMADLYNQLQLVNWNIYLLLGLLSHRRNTKLVSDLSENGVRGLMGVTFLQRNIRSERHVGESSTVYECSKFLVNYFASVT